MTATLTAETIAKFEQILDVDRQVRAADAAITFRGCGVSAYRLNQMHLGLEAAQKRMHDAIYALTDEECALFIPWKKEQDSK